MAEQASAAGAEGGADGGIAGASGGARQREVGEVDAEHQEHGADRRHEEDEALADVADHALLERSEAGVEVEIAGDLLADGGLHDVEFGLGLGGGDAGTEAGGGPVVEIAHVEFELVGLVAEGLVDFETVSERTAGRASPRLGKLKDAGRTPIISYGLPSSRILRPTMAGSAW